MFSKRKGYRVERNIRKKMEGKNWKVVRSGASLGQSDLICIRDKKCILLQIKSTKKKKFYYYDYLGKTLEGFPFYLVVDFGYGKIRILPPKKIVSQNDGVDFEKFLQNI
jgi:hypothetical protein